MSATWTPSHYRAVLPPGSQLPVISPRPALCQANTWRCHSNWGFYSHSTVSQSLLLPHEGQQFLCLLEEATAGVLELSTQARADTGCGHSGAACGLSLIHLTEYEVFQVK